MHPLIETLSEIAAAHPAASVRFVARELPFGRELLRELTNRRGALAGWEATTLRQLATEMGAEQLELAGFRRADDLALQAAADDAIDETASTLPPPLRRQLSSLGFRTSAFDAFAQLRMAGVAPSTLREHARSGSPAEALTPAYKRYCELLIERSLADAAEAFATAIHQTQSAEFAGVVIVIEPGAADVSGQPLRFVNALRADGAIFPALAETPPSFASPDLELVIARAASPALELREALRHALSTGAHWDQVELAVTDVDNYGTALASLGDELGIPYSLKEGVPMIRSRAGRSLERYLRWLDSGLPATPIRHALEQGELVTSSADVSAADVARAIRSANIGWGRDRWLGALARFENGTWVHSRLRERDERAEGEDATAREARLKATASATVLLLKQLTVIMPEVPEPSVGGAEGARIKTSTLAAHAIGWLDLVSTAIELQGEQHALKRLRGRLEELAAHDRSERSFALALAELRQGIEDLRAFPSADGASARRISTPGAVHLTDITQAGATGRPRLYLLGMDADRTSSVSGTDPILDEDTRAGIGAVIPSLRERSARKERALFRVLNGLSGQLWMSYATQSDSSGREASPSPHLLAAARQTWKKPELSYDELRDALGAPAGAARGHAPLDRRDVWLSAIAAGTELADGAAQVNTAWPLLARGFNLHQSAESSALTEWHGIVTDAANQTGFLVDPTERISPTSLETLAKCPLSWFYHYGLRLRLPEDVEFEATTWLDPRQRGLLLHAIFEQFVTAWMGKQAQLGLDEAADTLAAIVTNALLIQRQEIPPPSEMVFLQEVEKIERIVWHFMAQEIEYADATWITVEAKFPGLGAQTTFVTSDGTTLQIGGFIDRVDRYADGTLRIVDYKTGSSRPYTLTSKDAPLKGGRILQPAIYAAGASQALGGDVVQFEYRFPKERSPKDRVTLTKEEFAAAPEIVTSLLTHMRTGQFIPTNTATDCSYCDYRSICRVSTDQWDTHSPRVEWGVKYGADTAAYESLLLRRAPREKE